MTTEGGIVLSRLSENNSGVRLNVHDVRIGPDESNNVLVSTTDNLAALRAFFTQVKDRKEKVSLTINKSSDGTKKWTSCLGDALAENETLTSLDLTVNCFIVDASLGEDVGESLLQSSSLTSLSLTFNCSDMKEGWECNLAECLTKMASLTTLSLELNDGGEGNQEEIFPVSPTKLSNALAAVKSLSALSVAINNLSMVSFWDEVVGDCLRKCASLKKLSMTFNVVGYLDIGLNGIPYGIALTTSLNTLSVAMFAAPDLSGIFKSLDRILPLNSSASVNTLKVTVTLYEPDTFYANQQKAFTGLPMNTSITTVNLTLNEHGEGKSDIPLVLRASGVFEGLALNTSVTTFNLTLNSSKEVSDDWLPDLCDALKKNTSLTTLRLKVNNDCSTGESHLYDFSKLLIESQALSLLELEVSFYGKDSGCRKLLIQ